HGL
ncbi:hypothetical protein Vadar_015729, partial [Vaccinium darrowii]